MTNRTTLQRAKSFTLDYSEVALEDGTQLSDVPIILSIYLKVPVPETVLANWDAVAESGCAYDRTMVNGKEPSGEAYEKANNRPEEPALYTLTEIQ